MGDEHQDEYERRYMDPAERVLFREKVVSRTAFRVSVALTAAFGVLGLAALGVAAAGVVPIAAGVAIGAPFTALAAANGVLGVMFSVFRSMVTASHVHVHFGWAKRKIPMAAIQGVQVVRLAGFRQGKVSMGLDGVVRTWVGNSPSGQGVEITYQLEGERKNVLTVGSEDAERFVRTIERARAGAASARVRVEEVAAEHASAEAEADVAAGEPGEARRTAG
ncbi:MAG: hypothetical protein IT379_06980 [Deltaproteobacteria bacterium]|nr:hypothetical protein [Deltaproteobacteria bacterium]